jgi:hypothetical protein
MELSDMNLAGIRAAFLTELLTEFESPLEDSSIAEA